jgi:spectinomycin phosphotransferase
MLEKPDIPDALILARLAQEYGFRGVQLTFLPLGADVNTAVYHAVSADGADYFLKLRKGVFDEISVEAPHVFWSHGICEIIPPLETLSGRLWGTLEPYRMILYPFIVGQDGYQVRLSDQQWVTFGEALWRIHAVPFPPVLAERVPREDFTPRYREIVRDNLEMVERDRYADPVAAKLAGYIQAKRSIINRLVGHADALARDLQSRALEYVFCHSDIHPGNLLLGAEDALHIVDWDAPMFAPKERDLMLIGGCSTWHAARETALFYSGYGPVEINQAALAYYRCERIIWDIAAYCDQLLLSTAGGEDREQSYRYFISNFAPGGEIEIALQTEFS